MTRIDPNVHGLVNTALGWNPKSMRADPIGAALMDSVNASVADVLNPLIDMELYAPIILNPTRCLDADVTRVLVMNGIDRDMSLSNEQARRLAVIAQALRSWRGAFRSLRSVIGSMTGGPVIVRSWLTQRVVLDESAWDIVLISTLEYQDVTQAFLLGSGPDASYDATQVETFVNRLARTVLDATEYVPCYALSAWRDGLAGWSSVGSMELVTTDVMGEYESLDMGPALGADSMFRITSPTRSTLGGTSHWVTVWFKTSGADDDTRWLVLFASDHAELPTCYGISVPVGHRDLVIQRLDAGLNTDLLSAPVMISDGDAGDWHRLDIVMSGDDTTRKIRVYVDHAPTGWALDTTLPFPSGQQVEVFFTSTAFTVGRLRIAAITAAERT